MRKNSEAVTAPTPDMADQDWEKLEPESAYVKKCRLKPVVSQVEPWAALIKAVYEVDPLKCPKCGGTMKIISFIKDDATIQKILKHCGKWNEPIPRPPPQIVAEPALIAEEVTFDYGFTHSTSSVHAFDKLSACFEQDCV